MESKDKTIVTFHSGILTIGGTVIEVAYNNSHIFFDFGTEFRPELDLPDESLITLIDNGLVPELSDVYDPRLGYTNRKAKKQKYTHTAVFLSHAHLDHSKMINYLDPAIDLYARKETKAILKELNKTGDFLLPSPFENKNFTREINGVDAYEKIQIGEISVEILPVDHDAYGACGLLIHTPEKSLAYTGDLRLHGYDRKDTLEFCKRVNACDLLMMEGVSISFPDQKPEDIKVLSEEDLILQLVSLVKENPARTITFNGYPANVRRFERIVEKSPRKVVLKANMAALLLEIFAIKSLYYYEEGEKTITALDPDLAIEKSILLKDTQDFLWQVTDHFEQLPAESLYIHSDAEPLGEFDPSYAPFLRMLKAHQIEFVRLACTGHAFSDDLNKIITLIHPKLLVPIHTLHPEKLENPYGERILPTRGSSIVL
ncbi:MAG TPA: MBL fold metallo-hydrolase [Candidatus Tetragenococcus pullicola]|nr:MBL fold metallo-hydrolase [Candidatus Tetragenococcus pullicola]